MKFACPETMRRHVREVLEGAYDVEGLELEPGASVLDIGANVGSFALWAHRRWPGAVVTCYEPHPENFAALKQNGVGDTIMNAAVLGPGVDTGWAEERGPTVTLYDGRFNCGESSVFKGPSQGDGQHTVSVIWATNLPTCDVLKVDTEGCELGIISEYFSTHRNKATRPKAVCLEWHRMADRWQIAGLLASKGYECQKDHLRFDPELGTSHGVMVWRLAA